MTLSIADRLPRRVLLVRSLRAFADGYVSLLLPVYLGALGMSPLQIGAIATGTLLGSGVLTLWVGLRAYRYHYRSMLLAACVLMAGTGLGFAALSDFWPLLLVAVIGTLNPSSGDVSIFLPLEHAALSQAAQDRARTALFARYSLVAALAAAFGALFGGLPQMLADHLHMTAKAALQAMFFLYAAIAAASALIYRGLPDLADAETQTETAAKAPLKEARRVVYLLAALFSLDAFGGGFVVQAMLALWLFQKFQLTTLEAGAIFFWTGMLSALSYLVAVRIADRFGLVNTMVFTHLPSSIFLILLPFAPSIGWAVVLLLARAALSQMDVPTRSAYVMSIVPPQERPAAASITSVPRSLAATLGPVLAGYMLGISPFGWPLVIAGGAKIVYDILLLHTFRTVRPPHEARS